MTEWQHFITSIFGGGATGLVVLVMLSIFGRKWFLSLLVAGAGAEWLKPAIDARIVEAIKARRDEIDAGIGDSIMRTDGKIYAALAWHSTEATRRVEGTLERMEQRLEAIAAEHADLRQVVSDLRAMVGEVRGYMTRRAEVPTPRNIDARESRPTPTRSQTPAHGIDR